MDTALPQKFPFILDRNLAKANCTGNHVCTSCDKVVLDDYIYIEQLKLCKRKRFGMTYLWNEIAYEFIFHMNIPFKNMHARINVSQKLMRHSYYIV